MESITAAQHETLEQDEQARSPIVLLPAVREGDTDALLRALLVIARRIAQERQDMVQSTEAGELAA